LEGLAPKYESVAGVSEGLRKARAKVIFGEFTEEGYPYVAGSRLSIRESPWVSVSLVIHSGKEIPGRGCLVLAPSSSRAERLFKQYLRWYPKRHRFRLQSSPKVMVGFAMPVVWRFNCLSRLSSKQ